MNNSDNFKSNTAWKKFGYLKKNADKQRKTNLQKRLKENPKASDLEYKLGAFIEMYEPHLYEPVIKLAEKGYAIEASSGFGGRFFEFQVIAGSFFLDYVNKNRLEKIGLKFRDYKGLNSFIFWPEKAEIECIVEKWMQVIDKLPGKGPINTPSISIEAIKFRRKYVPEDKTLQNERIFERLKYTTQKTVSLLTQKRQKFNKPPDKTEHSLGMFLEEIEPQVRQAVLDLNKKGYSTDKSGFADNPCFQMIEGDFLLEEKTINTLQKSGVEVETNPSGYTRLQFLPEKADIQAIKKRWNKIISLIPGIKGQASVSMTRKARDFRTKYS